MDTASIKQLKDTLSTLGREELTGLLLRMVKFKKENKELLTFLLFEAGDLDAYVYEISQEIKDEFENYRLKTAYYKRKGVGVYSACLRNTSNTQPTKKLKSAYF